MTQRLDIEIPWIKYEHIENVKKALREVGLENGGTGPSVRPINACKGTVCKFGLYDTEEVTLEMHERFYKGYYDTKLPNKIRLGLCGCKNSCSKPQLACIGLVGRKKGQVAITIGGMFAGDKYIGQELEGLYTPEEALKIVERGILYFKEHGQPGERFAKMVNRISFEEVAKAMLQKE
jgi:dissimilatory sulfite reductase (desulfoviridin) alpha/beta subunit